MVATVETIKESGRPVRPMNVGGAMADESAVFDFVASSSHKYIWKQRDRGGIDHVQDAKNIRRCAKDDSYLIEDQMEASVSTPSLCRTWMMWG